MCNILHFFGPILLRFKYFLEDVLFERLKFMFCFQNKRARITAK
jgi:hypothetical protein